MKSFLFAWRKELIALWKTSENEVRSLNGLRAISAIGIFFFHTWSGLLSHDTSIPGYFEFIKINLYSFVDLFFVLSGFLVYGSLYREFKKTDKVSILKFYKNRALRILPAYYFFMMIGLIMLLAKINQLEGLTDATDAQKVLLTQYYKVKTRNLFDFVYLTDYFLGIHPHSWSLAIEFKFYIMLPFFVPVLLRLKKRTRIIWLATVYLLPLMFRFFTHIYNLTMPEFLGPYIYTGTESVHIRHQAIGSIYHFFHTRFDALVIGIIVFEIYTNFKNTISKKIIIYTIYFTSIAMMILAFTGFFDGNPLNRDTIKYSAFNISFAGLILAALAGPKFWQKIWSLGIWTPIARLSYSFYLWNMLGASITILYLQKVGIENAVWYDYLAAFTNGILKTLIVSLLIYVFIETPFLAWKRMGKSMLA